MKKRIIISTILLLTLVLGACTEPLPGPSGVDVVEDAAVPADPESFVDPVATLDDDDQSFLVYMAEEGWVFEDNTGVLLEEARKGRQAFNVWGAALETCAELETWFEGSTEYERDQLISAVIAYGSTSPLGDLMAAC